MRIGILGPLLIDVGDGPATVRGTRLRGLLARLAVDAGRPVPISTLAAALWQDVEPADPTGALQSLASRLRRVLGGGELLTGTPGGYRLDVPADDVDALRFERLTSDGRRALAAGDASTARALLAEGLDLWRGPALTDLADLPFASRVAVRWERLRLAAVEDRIEADLELGRGQQLVEEVQALVDTSPLRERLHGQLMRALQVAGRGAEALSHYAAVRTLLAEQLGTDPSPQLQALHARLLAQAVAAPSPPAETVAAPSPPAETVAAPPPPADTPPPDGDVRPHARAGVRADVRADVRRGVPLPLTSFVGRGDDLARVTELLQGTRLVTLVGPGGAGKTRLAIEVGHGWTRRVDEVRMVPLASVGSGSQVPRAALAALNARESGLIGSRAAALGLPEHPADVAAHDVVDRVVEILADRSVVLLLDNCEHVVEDAAALADALLQRCPGLRVLATSREPLHVLGESLHPVDPLSLPEPGCTPQDALRFPAVQLLADRAAAVSPGFAVDAATVGPAVEICRRLDGLPLAIELAAARLRTLPIALVAERLDDRFRLLTQGNRTALPRHRTLHAVVAWSWDLLTPAERELAECVAVLPGGIDAGSAAALTPGQDPAAIVDLLATLQDRSLLQLADTTADGRPRYRMLETLREFGLERLAGPGRLDDVRARAAAHFVALAEDAEPRLRSADQLGALALLHAEHDNLLAALRWAADAGDAATAVRLGAALSWFWNITGGYGEAVTWLEVALSVPGPASADRRVLALAQYLMSCMFSGRTPPPGEFAELSARAEQLPADAGPLLVMVLPVVAVAGGDRSRALELIESGRAGDVDEWSRAALLLLEGVFAENAGEIDRALRAVGEALQWFRRIGDRWGMATALTTLGETLPLRGDIAGALAAQEEAARYSRELGDREDAAHLQLRSIVLALRQDEIPRDTQARIEQLLADQDQAGSTFVTVAANAALCEVNARTGHVQEARAHGLRALHAIAAEPLGPPQGAAMVVSHLAQLEAFAGRVDEAVALLGRPEPRRVLDWDMPVAAQLAVTASAVLLACGDAGAAARMIGAAAAIRGGDDATDWRTRQVTGALRDRLGEPLLTELRDRGAAMPRQQALDLLAGVLAGPPARQGSARTAGQV